MHAFKCPKCGRLLATPTAAKKATVKCRACGALFVGDSTPIVSATPEKQTAAKPGAATAAATARKPIRRGPSNAKILMIIVMAVMVVGLTVMFIVMGSLADTTEFVYVDGNGRQVRERMTREQAEAKKEQMKKDAESAALAALPRPKPAAKADDANAASEVPDNTPPTDPNELADKGIELKQWTKVPEGTASHKGAIVGIVHSDHESCLAQVTVEVNLLDKTGKSLGKAQSAPIMYVPADGNVRFTAKYNGVRNDDIDKITILGFATPFEMLTVCWDANVTGVEVKDGKAIATGVAVVVGEKKLHSPMVHCEFYSDQGVLLNDVTADLEGAAKGIAHPGAAMKFTATLKLDGKKAPAGVTACARLAGTLEDARSGD